MISIANRHPKLHLFQAVTDFVKIDVGMSISNAYHPNSHSCMHTFCTTIPNRGGGRKLILGGKNSNNLRV